MQWDNLNLFLSPRLIAYRNKEMKQANLTLHKSKLNNLYTDLATQYLWLRQYGLFERIPASE